MAGTVNASKQLQHFAEDIKLHVAEEPWKPSFKLKRSSETDHGTSVEKKLKRNALSILNKITPEKFELLLKQLKKLNINDEQGSNLLICLIYDKAVKEPIYSVTYVKMCKFLAPIKIATTNFQAADFHSLFLQKCAKEFDNALLDQSKFVEKLNSLDNSFDQDKLKQEMWEEQCKIKRRLLGNVKLLGELFNQQMLPESVVYNCLKTLCCDKSEVLLEALCLLLKTAGKELLKDKNAVYTSQTEEIFQKMLNVVDKHLSSTRIRFMILDITDLKENNWISRRDEVIPKTIEEIHREAELEENVQKHIQNNKIIHSHQSLTDQIETKTKRLMEEFLVDNELEPIFQFVGSLPPNRVSLFIKASVSQVLEESPQSRNSVGELLFQLVKQKFVKIEQYRDGFSSVVEECRNPAADTSLIWNNMGEIIYPLMKNDQNSLQFLKVLLKPHVSSNSTDKIVSGVFHCLASREGSHKARLLWDEFKEELNEVLSNHFNIDEIILASSLCDDGDVQNKLLKLLQNAEENEKICHWIDINIPNTTDHSFVHALVSAVMKYATIANERGLDEEKFQKSLSLLSVYISGKEDLELQALYAVQLFIQELQQSKGFLKQTFEILHKNEVVATESFKKWEEGVSSSETMSKKIAFDSVKAFLSQLKLQDS